MKDKNYCKGKEGEKLAKGFLEKKGWRLIEMNYANKQGEIDLIMVDKSVLVFVEVKLKVGEEYGRPEEMIGPRKLWKIRRAAERYLSVETKMAKKYGQQRIDAVCIVKENNKVKRISHYENIEG